MAFEIAKALKHRVILLSGEEELLRRRGLQDLLDAAGVDEDGFDTEPFDGSDNNPENWIASCGTSPFLSDRRVAVVRHVLRSDADKVKPEALKGLPASALLILVVDDEGGDDSKQQKTGRTKVAWEKLVKAGGGFIETFTIKADHVRGLLKQELAKTDRKMSDAALDTLLEMCGGSFTRCNEELEKLLLYTHGEKSIQESHVRELVVPSREWNVFKLVDAIVGGQVGDALRQIRILVGSQNKAEDAAMRAIFPMMSRSLKLLWQGRLFLDGRCTPATATPEVLARLPEKPNLMSEKDWLQKKSMNGARNVKYAQLSRAMEVLALTDARLKGIEPGFSGMDSLERMALEMVDIFRSK